MSPARQPATDYFARPQVVRDDEPPELGPDDVGDLEPLSPHIASADSREEALETPARPVGIPVGRPARSPAQSPVGMALGMVPGDALGMPSGSALGQPQGTTMGGNSDWLLWWGTFQRVPGARLLVWRCSPSGLNVGEALLVMTVEDAQRMRLDDHPTALAYLTGRFGPGRFRLTPRSDQGTKLPGTQSLVAIIDEDTPKQVTMNPTAATSMVSPAGQAAGQQPAQVRKLFRQIPSRHQYGGHGDESSPPGISHQLPGMPSMWRAPMRRAGSGLDTHIWFESHEDAR